ncbi:hypothetical protein AYR66_12860 [Noviherbaspirillum denitrificans]|uniref:Uncharacterized protein n=1 Tax=Noviherbaspirillum denitrificans TaxID=1968433 RepID=A0A254TC86_9BURK|nr:hypothetical protein AYR66_12860 [Noviherbaspirillum denitrificans]
MDPVVGGAWLFAEHGHLDVAQAAFVQALEKFVSNHAVADNKDFHASSLFNMCMAPTRMRPDLISKT